jgi:hypothetical protein
LNRAFDGRMGERLPSISGPRRRLRERWRVMSLVPAERKVGTRACMGIEANLTGRVSLTNAPAELRVG